MSSLREAITNMKKIAPRYVLGEKEEVKVFYEEKAAKAAWIENPGLTLYKEVGKERFAYKDRDKAQKELYADAYEKGLTGQKLPDYAKTSIDLASEYLKGVQENDLASREYGDHNHAKIKEQLESIPKEINTQMEKVREIGATGGKLPDYAAKSNALVEKYLEGVWEGDFIHDQEKSAGNLEQAQIEQHEKTLREQLESVPKNFLTKENNYDKGIYFNYAEDRLKEVKDHKTEPYKLNITLPESFKELNNLAKKMESLPKVEFSKKEIVIEKETPSAQFSSDIFER